jgi:Na+/H+ antiporter NhaD/arsenite permease-like protein
MQICILNFRMEILRNMIFFVFLRYLVVCNIQKIILLFFLFLFLLKGLRKINEKKRKKREEGNRKAKGLFCFSIIIYILFIYLFF